MTRFDSLAQASTAHSTRAAEKLHDHGLVTGTLTVFFHTNSHTPERPHHSTSRSVRLLPMSNNTFDLVDAAVGAARRAWKGDPAGNGCAYTKAGIILDDLLAEQDRPELLFPADRQRDARLMDALDALNDRFGKKTVVLGREGFEGDLRLRAGKSGADDLFSASSRDRAIQSRSMLSKCRFLHFQRMLPLLFGWLTTQALNQPHRPTRLCSASHARPWTCG